MTESILANKFASYQSASSGMKGKKRPAPNRLKKMLYSAAEGFDQGVERGAEIVEKGEAVAKAQPLTGDNPLAQYPLYKKAFFRGALPIVGAIQGAVSEAPLPTPNFRDSEEGSLVTQGNPIEWRSINEIMQIVQDEAPEPVKEATVATIKMAQERFNELPPSTQQILREGLSAFDIVTTLAPTAVGAKTVKEGVESGVEAGIKGAVEIAGKAKGLAGEAATRGRQVMAKMPDNRELFLQNVEKIQPRIQKYIKSYTEKVDKKKLDSALSLTTPKLTPKVKQQMFKEGRLKTGFAAEKIVYNAQDYKIASAVAKIDGYKPDMYIDQAQELVESQIKTNSDTIALKLRETGQTYSEPELQGVLNTIKKGMADKDNILFGNDVTLQKYYLSVLNEFEKIVPKNGTLEDLWMARIDLDRKFKQAKGDGAFDKNTMQTQALKDVRDAVNDYITVKSKKEDYAEFLDETSTLYRASDRMSTQARTNSFSKIQEKFKSINGFYHRYPVVASLGLVGIGAGAVMSTPVVVGGLATYIAGKGLIAGIKQAEKGLVKILQTIDSQISKSSSKSYVRVLENDKQAVKEAIQEIKLLEAPKEKPVVKNKQSFNQPEKAQTIAPELKPLYEEAKKYKSAEEFVEAQGTPVYRGEYDRKQAVDDAMSTSLSKEVAESFSADGKIKEMIVDKNAKIIDISNLRREILGVEKLPNPSTLTKKQFDSIVGNELINYARQKGYDVIDYTKAGLASSGIKIGKILDEQEYQIINPSILKTKSQLTDIWNEANSK